MNISATVVIPFCCLLLLCSTPISSGDCKTQSCLTELYNSNVKHAEYVQRPLSKWKSGPRLHHAVKVTLDSGEQYLIHKGPDFGKTSDTVVTPASNMKPGEHNWKTTRSAPIDGKTVNDFMKHADPNTKYDFWSGEHCQKAAKSTWKHNIGETNKYRPVYIPTQFNFNYP